MIKKYNLLAKIVWVEATREWHLLDPVDGSHIQELKWYECKRMQKIIEALNLDRTKETPIVLTFRRLGTDG